MAVYKQYFTIVYFCILLLAIRIQLIEGQANYCNVDGVTHQVGETWTTATGNDRLKKCTCKRRGEWSCGYAREDALMVVADVNNIAKVKLSDAAGFKTQFIRDIPGRTVAVDVDIESDTIYWTDVSFKGRGIYKATFTNGNDVRRFITEDVYEPNGIAVDWLAKNIYWTDAQMRAIYVAKDTGQDRTMVIGGLSEPRGIVVLPLHGILFWTDQEEGVIQSASMDGSNRKVVIAGLGWPNEITVDVTRNKVYWIDGKKRTIESCNFDGTSWQKVLDFAIAFDSPGYGLSLFGGRLYFTIWEEKAVYSVTVLGQDLRAVVSDMNEELGGLAIVNSKLQQAPISNNVGLCRRHRSPCSHICLPKSRAAYTCSCPEKSGMVLSQDQHTCKVPNDFLLFTSVHDGSIMIASKEFGTKPNPVLLAYASQPSAIDYDPVNKFVYWSDVAKNAIYRMRLNGTGYDIFLENGIGIVDGIAVDWVNRYLYFTNYGWEAPDKPYARIEIIRLDGTQRKVLVSQGLDKPRDIVIDQDRGLLYYSDWGVDAKVVRLDLDGQNPHVVPIDVENPNGLAFENGILYVTDSHRKSALVEVNGTIVYGKPPALIKYDTVLDKLDENMALDLEIPFGLAMDKKSLYVTDWGTGGISEIDINTEIKKPIAMGMGKPTGIVRASLNPIKTYRNDCTMKKKCSHMCVPVDQDYSSCICPDNVGQALSENDHMCVVPDRFTLIADVNKIIMLSDTPDDSTPYMVVRTFDDYSNIVAIAYDPPTKFIYWADNGRQKICRKALGSANDIKVIYTEIDTVEGMALDPENRLLYWTDSALGTIEVLDLSRRTHATVHDNLINPRAIALNPTLGVLYWTEWGKAAMLMSSRMNGHDPRALITEYLEWPNGLYYDVDEDRVYVADGSKLKIQSIATASKINDGIDFLDINLTDSVKHMFGIGKMGSYFLFTDWESGTVFKREELDSSILVTNLTRPTQIVTQYSTYMSEIKSQCATAIHKCSHICVPSAGSYKCLCPDHLYLADNLRNCVRLENLDQHTTTLKPTTPHYKDDEVTTMETYENFTEMVTEEVKVVKVEKLPETTTPQPNTTMMTSAVVMETVPTTPVPTTTVQTTPTTIPPMPRFPKCQSLASNETAVFIVHLPKDDSTVEVTAEILKLRALNIKDKDLKVLNVNEEDWKLYPGTYNILFNATDKYNRTIFCNTTVTVKDVTPPRVTVCPSDLDLQSYDTEDTTFVTWVIPKFEDNSGAPPTVINTHSPGMFLDGLHTISYTAYDNAGNKATCTFMVAVMHLRARCGSPSVPPNSFLSCASDLEDQVCQISCNEGYSLSLKTPQIKCRADLDQGSIVNWLPYVYEGVCKEPKIGNPQRVVTLQYDCPCKRTHTFYEFTLQNMRNRLQEVVSCNTRKTTLGLCVNPDQKIFVECSSNATMELTVKVDLAKLEQVPSMSEARRIVKRSVTDILDQAVVAGTLTVQSSNLDHYSANKENYKVTEFDIQCKKGFKVVEDGCVECPRGTFWNDSDCEFCPLHTFQEHPGRASCMECSEDKGTISVGAKHRSHCVEMVRQEAVVSPSVALIASAAVGGLVLLAVIAALVAFFWRRRKRRKQAEKEAAERRRRRREKRRRNSANMTPVPELMPHHGITTMPQIDDHETDPGDASDGRTSKRSSSSAKRVTIKEETIEHSIPHRDEIQQRKAMAKPTEPNWRMALVMRNTPGNKKPTKIRRVPSSVATDDARSETSAVDSAHDQITEDDRSQFSATHSEAETDKTLTDGETTRTETDAPTDTDASTIRGGHRLMSSTSDLGDETISMTSGASSRATTPIKGVLKKPRRIVSMDDAATFTTDSTLSNTLENARISGDSRGRSTLRRSQRNGHSSVSPSQGNKPQAGPRRSLSFDRGPTRPQKMFDRDPRFNTMGRSARPPMPGLQQPMFPPGARPRFVGGPRMMTRPPPGAMIYRHPNHPNVRMAFVPMNQGARPMMPGRMPMPPPYAYNDSGSEWDNMSQVGSDIDMRKPPRHMMPPPPGMMPGYQPRYARMRMPMGGMGPPRFPGGFPGGPMPQRFQPRPGY